MKTLVEYIKEALIFEADSAKSFTFNFNELPNKDDIVKQLKQIADDGGFELEEAGESLTLKIDDELKASSKLTPFRDAIEQYADTLRKDSKNASSEGFAQTTKKFKDSVDAMITFLEEEPEMPTDAQEEQREKTDEE